ncbi:GIY-YIG nuclease family protein [Hyalangium minutum]|uniref:GIY-YIG nuclease family protein n=1 Tax=Hyalangium minutum TaxID=394096 RepID=UPI0012F9C2E0|nr:GIY-YIG nuclease family protein [Hyalangium minutum]
MSVGSAPEAPRVHLLPELAPAAAELKRCYLQWCGRTWGEGDCLRLLVDKPELDNDGKYTLAMAIAQRHVLGEMKDAFGEMVNPVAVYASITSAMTVYLLLWTLPEPVSKGLAATMTVALMAYLGVDTVWRLIDGWLVVVREVDRATTFEEIEVAGTKYGKTMGRTAAKAFVMLATVAVGNTAAGMASRLPTLPGAGPAAVLAETQLNLRYAAAASQVEAVTVSAEGATLTLAPGAVAMAARGAGSRNNSVYRSVSPQGQVQYVGITNNVARRAVEHLRQNGFDIDKLLGNLSREDARAVEQALIEIHGLGKNGGTLLNRINSIARTRPDFAALLRRGQELLNSIGYRVE